MTEPDPLLQDKLDVLPERPSALPWVVAGVAVLAALLFLFLGMFPAMSERDQLERKLAAVEQQLLEVKSVSDSNADALGQAQEKLASVSKEKATLAEENQKTGQELKVALREKEKALQALQEVQKEIKENLSDQIAAGDVLIKERNGQLVIDVSDRLLFDKGETAINKQGQKLLLTVARSMRRLPRWQVFQVGGHTDSLRVSTPDLKAKYPTNWELSTGRATNVVRHLQDRGRVPGRQLVAAGFGRHRPVSANTYVKGRQRNRRIEIVLLERGR